MPNQNDDMHAIRNSLAIAHGHTWLAWKALGKDEIDRDSLVNRLHAALDAMDKVSKLVNKKVPQDDQRTS